MKIFSESLLFTLLCIIASCEHAKEEQPACVAGTGGNVTLAVHARFGGTNIPNYVTHPDTAFIKFGTTISPGVHPGNYDIFFTGSPGEDHIHCPELKCGDYFIYRTAWDSVANVRRYGGTGITVSETSGEKEVFVDVH